MLAFDRACGDKKVINDICFKRFGLRPGYGGFHAVDVLAVREKPYRRGFGIGNQMPEGKNRVIGLPFGKWDNFYLGQPVIAVETEGHGDRHCATGRTRWNRTRGMGNLNGCRLEPVGEKANVETSKHNRDGAEKPLFFFHKSTSVGMN